MLIRREGWLSLMTQAIRIPSGPPSPSADPEPINRPVPTTEACQVSCSVLKLCEVSEQQVTHQYFRQLRSCLGGDFSWFVAAWDLAWGHKLSTEADNIPIYVLSEDFSKSSEPSKPKTVSKRVY
jgi:hypothetical protein